MSATAEAVLEELGPMAAPVAEGDKGNASVIPLADFLADFGDGLLEAVSKQNPPVYDGTSNERRDAVMEGLLRKPYPAQRDAVQALTALLLDHGEPAGVLNAEMGTGKTIMAIALAAVMQEAGYQRTLVISPPHLVYKWRREILETVENARVVVLNGSDTLRKLVKLRKDAEESRRETGPVFYILGRVRMRMGFHWKPVVVGRKFHVRKYTEEGNVDSKSFVTTEVMAACPCCGEVVKDEEKTPVELVRFNTDKRTKCKACGSALWSLVHPGAKKKSHRDLVKDAMCGIPTIGPKTADRLLNTFGEKDLGGMLGDNMFEFINLMDEDGELVFSDRQARRMERAMGKMELSFGQGGYQPTEFIKRYLPDGYFDLLVVDEGHEYKNAGSAQGQAMGVLAAKVEKVVLLTGTLMGGYADDLFHLLWRMMPARMLEDGYGYNQSGSIGSAAMAFMREHGVLKDIYTETDDESHRTSRGRKITHRVAKGPGFGPLGIARFVLPYTVFLKLKDIGSDVLPAYTEHFTEIAMEPRQAERYAKLSNQLTEALRKAIKEGDKSLLGVVLNVLLRWPDSCFREEVVKHPIKRDLIAYVPPVLGDDPSAKEEEMLSLCRKEKARGRKVLVYTTYTGKWDTMARMKRLLEEEGFKVAVLRSSVGTDKREDWILNQVDRGIDVLITNPELVKTGLDLLDFPTIVYMQTGYNVYTLQQASRRSWRIGQKHPVDVHFLGYGQTAQITCLSLMAKKIAVSQSTSGDVPATGLDSLNDDGDSVEVALARELVG